MIQESRAKLQNLSHVAASTRPLVGIHWHTTSSGPTNFYLTLNLELNLFSLELFRKYLDGNSAQKKNTAFWGQKFPKLHCSYANKTSKRISQNRASACLIHFLPIVHIMLRCSHCNRMDFKSKHGLNLHLLKNAVCSALERQKLNPIQLPDPVQVRPNPDLPAPNNHGQVPSNDGTQVEVDRVAGPPDDDQSAGFGAAGGDDDSDYVSDHLVPRHDVGR